jgi:hypothetical protein
MVRRWHLLILLFAPGCNAPAAVDHASIIADIAVRYAAIVCRQKDVPDEPKEGCVAGCGCNGTGKEKSGDGLAVVNCRCDDDCECKPKATSPKMRSDPPLKAVPQKKPAPDASSAATARAIGWMTRPANDIEWCDEAAVQTKPCSTTCGTVCRRANTCSAAVALPSWWSVP